MDGEDGAVGLVKVVGVEGVFGAVGQVKVVGVFRVVWWTGRMGLLGWMGCLAQATNKLTNF